MFLTIIMINLYFSVSCHRQSSANTTSLLRKGAQFFGVLQRKTNDFVKIYYDGIYWMLMMCVLKRCNSKRYEIMLKVVSIDCGGVKLILIAALHYGKIHSWSITNLLTVQALKVNNRFNITDYLFLPLYFLNF